MSAWRKLGLTGQIAVAMVAGIITGIALFYGAADGSWLQMNIVDGLFLVIGKIFVNALKMMVVPLVLVSLVGGVTALGDPKALGRIGGKALLLYLFTTCVAISLALGLATLINPGAGLEREAAATFAVAERPPLTQVLIDMVPSNPIAAMADGAMLAIIVFALLLGIAITLIGNEANPVKALFASLNAVIMKMVELSMLLAPIGVFCLIARTFAQNGLDFIGPLGLYFFTVALALLLHAGLTLTALLTVLGRLNPVRFFSKLRAMVVFAFSTASSNATIPVTLRTVTERLGVKNSVASFTVPLGATINMDGTAIMQGVATVFIANVYGIDLSFADFMTVIATATLASIGTAGVPGVGLIMLAMVLGQVGLPVEGIALIIGVDRLLDMMRTAVNVSGDATVSCLVAKSEGALDESIFNDPNAGVIGTDDKQEAKA